MNSFGSRGTLKIGGSEYLVYRLSALEKAVDADLKCLPFSIRVLLENLLRREDGENVTKKDIEALAKWNARQTPAKEIAFMPGRVILQDFTGVPAVVDLAAMRDRISEMGGNPKRINPLEPADLVIDHSIQVDHYGDSEAFARNVSKEFERNKERYQFLKWGQQAFKNFRVVPPGTGIIHQVNLEYLAPLVMEKGIEKSTLLYPDTLVGTDSHTTMINGLGVLGWGVGGIEAEAAMLGQPISMLVPEVIGLRIEGKPKEGRTATDIVLTVTEMLRKKGVVGKFVEFFGPGLDELSLADRATIANMAPEYGATVGFFPVDEETLNYLRLTGRDKRRISLIESYLKEQGLFRTPRAPEPVFSDALELDLGRVEASIAGPKRPQDRIPLVESKASFKNTLAGIFGDKTQKRSVQKAKVNVQGKEIELGNGSVVIASITSCTNTSNPAVMIGAGILAKKAVEAGLEVKPWVKTSLAPGSKVVMDYLKKADLLSFLEKLRFHLVGFGCATCIGNSGPLSDAVTTAIKENHWVVASVLSGNRNFEGRIHSLVRANYLASPPVVVAYAIAGTMAIDLTKDPLGVNSHGKPVYLRDVWPTEKEIQKSLAVVQGEMFCSRYHDVFEGDEAWKAVKAPSGDTFLWDEKSLYVKKPPFFECLSKNPEPVRDISNARVLVMVGDSVTTDHISPAGAIPKDSPAGQYLMRHGVKFEDFNSYGSRRGNHEVMMRGTFGNVRLRNLLAPGSEGGITRHMPSGESMSIYEAALKYRAEKVPLMVIAGKEYGTGSSRDWAAKGPALLGVNAVIAESFERIHRSNLIGMGILPLQFEQGANRESLGLTGSETFSVEGISDHLEPGKILACRATGDLGNKGFSLVCRIDTPAELAYYYHGGILQYVLRKMLSFKQ